MVLKEFPWKLLQTKAAFVAVIVGAILNRSWSGEAPARIDSNPRLVRKVDFGEYGSRHIRFGDLDGDGLPEIVLVQANPSTAYITCLTAIDLEGRILWQVGSPDVRNSYYKGENLQIYDLDHDGQIDAYELQKAVEQERKSHWRRANELFGTHPPTYKRILVLEEMEEEIKKGGLPQNIYKFV